MRACKFTCRSGAMCRNSEWSPVPSSHVGIRRRAIAGRRRRSGDAAVAPARAFRVQRAAGALLHADRCGPGGCAGPLDAAAIRGARAGRSRTSRASRSGTFDNLTGEPVLDDDVAQFGRAACGGARQVRCREGGAAMAGSCCTARCRRTNGQFTVQALLADGSPNGISWSTIDAPPGHRCRHGARCGGGATAGGATGQCQRTAARAGPRPGSSCRRCRRSSRRSMFAICLHGVARQRGGSRDGDAAIACFDTILVASRTMRWRSPPMPGSRRGGALYAHAGEQDLAALMVGADHRGRDGRCRCSPTTASSTSSRRWCWRGRVRSMPRSARSTRRWTLNPASMDAVAADGLVTWLDGALRRGHAARRAGDRAAVVAAALVLHDARVRRAAREALLRRDRRGAWRWRQATRSSGRPSRWRRRRSSGAPISSTATGRMVMGNRYFQAAGILPRLGDADEAAGADRPDARGAGAGGHPAGGAGRAVQCGWHVEAGAPSRKSSPAMRTKARAAFLEILEHHAGRFELAVARRAGRQDDRVELFAAARRAPPGRPRACRLRPPRSRARRRRWRWRGGRRSPAGTTSTVTPRGASSVGQLGVVLLALVAAGDQRDALALIGGERGLGGLGGGRDRSR